MQLMHLMLLFGEVSNQLVSSCHPAGPELKICVLVLAKVLVFPRVNVLAHVMVLSCVMVLAHVMLWY